MQTLHDHRQSERKAKLELDCGRMHTSPLGPQSMYFQCVALTLRKAFIQIMQRTSKYHFLPSQALGQQFRTRLPR
jgi:hypothetical protein